MRGLATPVIVTRVEHIAAKALVFMFLPNSIYSYDEGIEYPAKSTR
jgi:hypothetical protein